MESALLGLTIDSSIIITAERRGQSVAQLIESIKRHTATWNFRFHRSQ
jgi:hypothetical protein